MTDNANVESSRTTRCRVEFPTGVHACHASSAWTLLEKKLGSNWVVDTGVDEAKRVTMQVFEEKLRVEGELLVWTSKEHFTADPTAENIAATVIACSSYLVETPCGSQRVRTLSAAGHIAAARGWHKISRDSETVPRLSKYEMQEFLNFVEKHDPRKVKPSALKNVLR